MEKTFAVIMAGGVGARFWPSSRAARPKQLLDLTGSGTTMIAATLARLAPEIPAERVLVVTGRATAVAVRKALPTVPRENILAEPVGRNTAPCIGWAALHARRRDPDAVLAVLPSDHLVRKPEEFHAGLRKAVGAAREGALVTCGIAPDRPETGFGYIELGEPISDGVCRVVRFVEKPDLETAKGYVASGRFAWNSGMFFFSAARVLDEIARQMPELKRGLEEIDAGIAAGDERAVVERVFPKLPAQSIDYGVMERAAGIACVPLDIGWSDLGSWSAAHDLSQRDAAGNAFGADVVAVDARGCLVRAPSDVLVALVGVEDLVVVDTGDCLLVCKKDRAQDVKRVLDILKERGRGDLL
jgi:mannose-1-phosphate guanylyltransferase